VSEHSGHGGWHGTEVFQKRAQKAHRAELNGKPEPIVLAAMPSDLLTVEIIKVEVARQDLRRRFAVKTAIAVALFLSQKSYRHLRSFLLRHWQNLGLLHALTISLVPGLLRLQKSGAKGYSFAGSFAKPQVVVP
jgi:hypothetical protein